MRCPKGWLACLMVVAIGIFVLGSPPKASATFQLALQEDGGAITPVVTNASFAIPTSFAGVFGDYTISSFAAEANNNAGGSNLLSTTLSVVANSAATHTLRMFVSNQDFTLPAGPLLTVMSDMGGTYGFETGFTGSATFQIWADSGNGLNTIPGTFSNGLQPTTPASGNGVAFTTGTASGLFTRGAGPYSLTTRTNITTTGVGDVNYVTHLRVTAAPVSVPEPETPLIMLMVGILGLFIGVRRKTS